MSGKKPTRNLAASLNAAIRALHGELKSLILTCDMVFPKRAVGGLRFLADVLDLQGCVTSFNRQIFVRLFQSASRGTKGASSILSNANAFNRLYAERRKLHKKERRSEKQIDAAVRRRMKVLLQKVYLLGEDEMRALNRDRDLPEIVYYLSMLEGSLCWYADRHLARMTGELAKMEM